MFEDKTLSVTGIILGQPTSIGNVAIHDSTNTSRDIAGEDVLRDWGRLVAISRFTSPRADASVTELELVRTLSASPDPSIDVIHPKENEDLKEFHTLLLFNGVGSYSHPIARTTMSIIPQSRFILRRQWTAWSRIISDAARRCDRSTLRRIDFLCLVICPRGLLQAHIDRGVLRVWTFEWGSFPTC